MARMRRGAGTLVVAIAVAAALAGCGGGDSDDAPEAQTTSTSTQTAVEQQDGTAAASGPDQAQIYFTTGEQFKPVERNLPPGAAGVEQAAEELIQGPTPSEQDADAAAQTQIPADTELQDITVEGDGTAVVEVSQEFLEGIPSEAGARTEAEDAELNARLGQVTYTLTQFDQVEATQVVAGGIAVEPPLERADYRKPKQGPEREVHAAAGAKTLATREAQKRLAALGYLPPRAVDGVPGYRTEQAVVAFQAWEGLDRDGVVGPLTTAALKKAKRPRPRAGGPDRRIEVYRAKGVALLVAHGKTRRAIHVSTGAGANATPAGTFEVFRKELRSWSVPFQVWLPYASYFNQGIAFHEYPDVPPYPASHGCVRVPAPEAEGVYRFAKLGTPVVVL